MDVESVKQQQQMAQSTGKDLQLKITYVTNNGPYLKICGQLNPEKMPLVRRNIQETLPYCGKIGVLSQQIEMVKTGTLCIFYNKKRSHAEEEEYMRGRVKNFSTDSKTMESLLDVELIDFGKTVTTNFYELLLPLRIDILAAVPPLATQYFLKGICKEFKDTELHEISRMILYQTLDISIQIELEKHLFISMKWRDFNFAEYLVLHKKIGAFLTDDLLKDSFLKFLRQNEIKYKIKQHQQQQQQQQQQQSIVNNNNLIMNNNSDSGINTALQSVLNPGFNKTSVTDRLRLQRQHLPLNSNYTHTAGASIVRPQRLMAAPFINQNLIAANQMQMNYANYNNRAPFYPGTGIVAAQNLLTTNHLPLQSSTPMMNQFAPYAAPMRNTTYSPARFKMLLNEQTNQLSDLYAAQQLSEPAPFRTFKETFLTTVQSYRGYVSSVEDGPNLFWVLNNSHRDALTQMMMNIRKFPLRQLTHKLPVGAACIARFSQDNYLYRAKIINVEAMSCKVIYVDYGYSESVNYCNLYQIPECFLELEPFAMPYYLSKHYRLVNINEELRKAFKSIIEFQVVQIKVVQQEEKKTIGCCQVFFNNKNIVDTLLEYEISRLQYPQADHLEDGDVVEIRYIDSPKRFYVQKIANMGAFEKLMDDMYIYYNTNQMVPTEFLPGVPCIVKYDNEWYRAEMIKVDKFEVVVYHVDFGYKHSVSKHMISNIAKEHTKLPRQAIKCCLKGFEVDNLKINLETSLNRFEMMADESNREGERRAFNVKVFKILRDDLHLVNLWTQDLNVMKKLFKLSMPLNDFVKIENKLPQIGGILNDNRSNKSMDNRSSKTPSLNSAASSNDVMSNNSGKKKLPESGTGGGGAHSNNSSVLSSNHYDQGKPSGQQQQQQQRQQQQQQQYQRPPPQFWRKPNQLQQYRQQRAQNFNTRSSPKDDKPVTKNTQQQQQPQQQQQNQYQKGGNKQIQSDAHSTSSGGSGSNRGRSQRNLNNSGGGGGGGTSIGSGGSSGTQRKNQMYQQNKQNQSQNQPQQQQVLSSPTHNKRAQQQQPPRQQQQQQQHSPRQQQRSQNAPQGYSQSPVKQSPQKSKAARKIDDNVLTSQNNDNNANTNNKSGNTNSPTQPQSPVKQKSEQKQSKQSIDHHQQQQQQPEKYLPLNESFPVIQMKTPKKEDVIISWWISPYHFYTQIKSRTLELEKFEREMRDFYETKPSRASSDVHVKAGSSVIVRDTADGNYHRARVLSSSPMTKKYRVMLVDYGRIFTVSSKDISRVEKRFSQLPCVAYRCSLCYVISKMDHLEMIDLMSKYLPSDAASTCEYLTNENELYYVNLKVNNVSVRDAMIKDGLLYKVQKEFRLELLVGQQIRAKIFEIKSMLNFKIYFNVCDNDIELLSSYDDVSYVKSNPIIAKKFKLFYENKSCVLNITSIDDNKVVRLRPLLPLFRDDIPTYVCQTPIVYKTFQGIGVYCESNYLVHIQPIWKRQFISELLQNLFLFYEENAHLANPLRSFETGKLCAASANDKNWYRCRIISENNEESDMIRIVYVDYGNEEIVEKFQLRELEKQFYENIDSGYVAVHLPITPISPEDTIDIAQKEFISNDELTNNDKMCAILNSTTQNKIITISVIEFVNNHIIGDVIFKDDDSLLDVFHRRELTKTARDVDVMRKILSSKTPNVMQHIEEVVDLTQDDEDNSEKKQSRKAKGDTARIKQNSKNQQQKQGKVEAEQTQEVDKKQAVEENIKTNGEIEKLSTTIVASNNENSTALPQSKTEIPDKEATPEPIIENNDPYAHMEQASLSHCDNPGQFYIHLEKDKTVLQQLHDNLQIIASSLPQLTNIVRGAYCISKYSVDKLWYRAKILDAELLVLKFIDFGNTDLVNDIDNIKEINIFGNYEPFCYPCALPIRPNTTSDWLDAANAIFNDNYNKVMRFEYITHGDIYRRSFINLYIDGMNVAEQLIIDGFAKPLIMVDSGENCFISHVNGITDFSIQYEKNSKALELIERYLSDTEKLHQLETFEESKIVAALFLDDGQWYRAQLIKEIPETGYEVLFIDFGNTAVTTKCREISAEIAKAPWLSKKCALELPETCESWSEAAEIKFAEIANSGEKIFTVELRAPGRNNAEVHLLIDGHNIIEELEPLCDKKKVETQQNITISTFHSSLHEGDVQYPAFISHIRSPCDFFVQFSKDIARVDHITQTLNSLSLEAIENPEIDQLCAALFINDGKYYRARIMQINLSDADQQPEYYVNFIDFGNETTAKKISKLPEDLLLLKPCSTQCQLENSVEFAKLGGLATENFRALTIECRGEVKLSIVDKEAERTVVKLYSSKDDTNLCAKLNQLLGLESVKLLEISNDVDIFLPLTMNRCLISEGNSPSKFFVQIEKLSADLEFIIKTLQDLDVKNLPNLDDVNSATIYIAYVEDDDSSFRCRVEETKLAENGEKLYRVTLIDYGSTLTTRCLRELPTELVNIPPLARKCKLNSIPDMPIETLEQNFAALIDFHFGEFYDIEEDNFDENVEIFTVKLLIQGKDVAEELKKSLTTNSEKSDSDTNAATNVELKNCTILQVNDDSSFYIQLEKDIATIENIQTSLISAAKDLSLLKNPHINDMCVAESNEDTQFHRVKLIQFDAKGLYEVQSLDYGKIFTVEKLYTLPDEELFKSDNYAKHCVLNLNEATLANNNLKEFMETKFNENFQIEILNDKEGKLQCNLFYKQENVATLIGDKTKSSAK